MASGSTARPRVFNGDAKNACWEGREVHTAEVTLVPPAQHAAPSGDAGASFEWQRKLYVPAPGSTALREQLKQWRLQKGHSGWATSSEILHRLTAREWCR